MHKSTLQPFSGIAKAFVTQPFRLPSSAIFLNIRVLFMILNGDLMLEGVRRCNCYDSDAQYSGSQMRSKEPKRNDF